jgi:hypothetical protein
MLNYELRELKSYFGVLQFRKVVLPPGYSTITSPLICLRFADKIYEQLKTPQYGNTRRENRSCLLTTGLQNDNPGVGAIIQ